MPSPPLAPDDGPIDLEHLKRMTLGDAGLEREVLAMFSAQAVRLIGALAAMPGEDKMTLRVPEELAPKIIGMCAPGWRETGKLYDFPTDAIMAFRGPG